MTGKTRPTALRRLTGPVLLAAAVALVATLAAPDVAQAQDAPCASLTEAQAKAYRDHALAAVTAYQESNFQASIAENLEALKICFEDPNLYYNLARAYHKAGDCHMALFTYEEISVDDLDKDKRDNVAQYSAELAPECGDSAVVLVTCEDSGVDLQIGDRSTTCPFSGRVDIGEHPVVASKDQHRQWTGTLRVVAGSDNTFDVPGLASEDDFGQLSVTCGAGISAFTVVAADGTEQTLPCPYDGEMAVGSYTLSTDPQGQPVPATVVGRQTTNIDALATPPPSSCACQVRSASATGGAPVGATLLMALLGLVFGLRRRRNA